MHFLGPGFEPYNILEGAVSDPFAALRRTPLIIDGEAGFCDSKEQSFNTPESMPSGGGNAADAAPVQIEIGADHPKFDSVSLASALVMGGISYRVSGIASKTQPTGCPVKYLKCYKAPQDEPEAGSDPQAAGWPPPTE